MGSIQFSLGVRAAARELHKQRRLPLLSCASSTLREGRTQGSLAFQAHLDALVGLICNITETTEKLHLFKLVMAGVFCLRKEKAC